MENQLNLQIVPYWESLELPTLEAFGIRLNEIPANTLITMKTSFIRGGVGKKYDLIVKTFF